MEAWSFPPAYDDDYLPVAGSRYWFPERETMPAGDRDRLILERLKQVCAYAYAEAPFYRRKWDEAGFHPSHLRSLEDFEDRVPVVTKADLRKSQGSAPPFGDYLCVPDSEIFHIHGTSGTTGRPTAFGIGRRDWAAIANAHARIMWGMGIRPGDRVCVAAILSLYLGSWGALAGAERLRAQAFPFGAGAPGMTVRCAQWLDLMKPAAFYGTPTYALHLGQAGDRRRPRPARLRSEDHVLLGRARRLDPRRPRPDRGDLRRQGHRLRLDGRDDALHERVGHGRDLGSALLAGRGLHRGLRSEDDAARSLWPARHARLYPSRTHLAADDPARVGRPHALDRRAEPLRAHLSAPAAGHLRADRRYVHDPGREHLSERDRRGAERDAGLRRRASDRHHPRPHHGTSCCCASKHSAE